MKKRKNEFEFIGFDLLGKKGKYYWHSPTTGNFSWGTFKTKKAAKKRMREYLDSF